MLNTVLNNKYVQFGLAAVAGVGTWEGSKAIGRLIGAKVDERKTPHTTKKKKPSKKSTRAKSHEAAATH